MSTTITVCKVCEAELVGIVRQCPGCGSEQLSASVRGTIAPPDLRDRVLRLERLVHQTLHVPSECYDDAAVGIVRCDCSAEAKATT
jgi:hypothetical protein